MKKWILFLVAAMLAVTFLAFPVFAEDGEQKKPSYLLFSDPADNQPSNAVILGPGTYYAIHFNTSVGFTGFRIAQWTPGFGEGEIEYVFSVFEWKGDFSDSMEADAVAAVEGVSTRDNLNYDITFDKTVPAGNYTVVLEIVDVNDSAMPGMHVQSGTILPEKEDCFEIEEGGSTGTQGDRIPTFRLITDGEADDSALTELPADPTREPTEPPTPSPEPTENPATAGPTKDPNAGSNAGSNATATATKAPSSDDGKGGCGGTVCGTAAVTVIMAGVFLLLKKSRGKEN